MVLPVTARDEILKTPLAIYKALPGSNCGQCGVPSCMAFAASVFQGMKVITACPHLEQASAEHYRTGMVARQGKDEDYGQLIKNLQEEVATLDFTDISNRIGIRIIDGTLAVPCLGRDFFIDQHGQMNSSCHINHWIQVPLLHYLLKCQGVEPKNNWIPFATLPGAGQWGQYFNHRCEKALQQLIDAHEGLMLELFFLFGAQSLTADGGADHSLSILPLPKVPFLINYWRSEEGFPSQLNILLDHSAAQNTTPHSITLLARGIIEMFRQLIVSHSHNGRLF